MKYALLFGAALATAACFAAQAEAQASGTLAHCCNFDDPQLHCSSSESHGNNDHSKCKTSFLPFDGKQSVCRRTITAYGVVMYEAAVDETATGLRGTVACAGGKELVASVRKNAAQFRDTVELAPGGRGLIFTSTLGTCEVSCISPDPPQSAACGGVLSGKV